MRPESPGGVLETVKAAIVAVIQTASERDHNSDAGEESFRELPLPWVKFEFFDENTVADFRRGIAELRFSAIVFASNSLFNGTIITGAREASGDIGRASAVGMGVLVLQQFLPPRIVRDCDFLPARHQVEYRGIEGQPIEEIWIRERAVEVGSQRVLTLDPTQYGTRSPTLWCEVKPLYEAEWRVIGRVNSASGSTPVIFRSLTPRARTIVTSLPLDWIADTSLLAYLVARAVRGRGTLYLYGEGEDQDADVALQLLLGRSIHQGGHLSRVAIRHPTNISARDAPFRHFSHLVLSPQWSWVDLAALRSESVKERLENGGSVTAHAGQFPDGQPMVVTVGGRPTYLELARRFAEFFRLNVERFADAPTSVIRSLAVATAAINASIADEDAVPRVISLGEMRQFIGPYAIRRRQGQDHVDGHVLPTAALASAMELLKFDAGEVLPLRRWIEAGNYLSSVASLQQADLWLFGICIPLGRIVPERSIDRLYESLRNVRGNTKGTEAVAELCTILEDETVKISTRAIVAESLTFAGDPRTLARVATSARTLQSDLESMLEDMNPPLESICLIVAALVRIHAAGGLVVAPSPETLN